jgi:hypothetical protein
VRKSYGIFVFFRAALDCIRKLDELLTHKKAYRDVFLPEAIGYRNR